jgi:hypothetical protein
MSNQIIEESLAKIKEHEKEIEKLEKKIENEYGKLTIRCKCCNKLHKIKNLILMAEDDERDEYASSTVWYYTQERAFICPDSLIRNRILFRNDCMKYNYAFNKKFSKMFKQVIKIESPRRFNYLPSVHSIPTDYGVDLEISTLKFINNYYVDDNPDKFNLVLPK